MTGFSQVRMLGRISPCSKGVLCSPSPAPRAIPPAVSTVAHAAIARRLAVVLPDLERDRVAHVERIDRTLKRFAGGAAVPALMLGWGIGGSFLGGLALMLLAAASTIILLMGKAEDGTRKATRSGILAAVAGQLSDMITDPQAEVPREWFAAPGMFQPVRKGFALLEQHARCAKHGLAEVAPGEGQRPRFAIIQGQLVVPTPLAMFDGAFETPPFSCALDPETLIPAFASDLAVLDGYLSAALSLPLGDIA